MVSVNKKTSVCFIIAILVAAYAYMLLLHNSESGPMSVLQQNPEKILDSCMEEKGRGFHCYEELYTYLTKERGIEYTFSFLREHYQEDSYARTNCHPITHVIGRAAAEKFDTVSEAYIEGDHFCASGYYHGIMEAAMADVGYENVEDNMHKFCAEIAQDRPYSLDHYNCVHGLGHGVMMVTQNELFESLEICDALENSWEQKSCWSGVFMENIVADDINHTTEYLRSDEPLYPCNAVGEQYRDTCYAMQSSYILQAVGGKFKEVFDWCKEAKEDHRPACYEGLGRDASGSTTSDPQRTKDICSQGEDFEQRSNCIIGAAKDFVYYYNSDEEALEFCALWEEELEEICRSTVEQQMRII